MQSPGLLPSSKCAGRYSAGPCGDIPCSPVSDSHGTDLRAPVGENTYDTRPSRKGSPPDPSCRQNCSAPHPENAWKSTARPDRSPGSPVRSAPVSPLSAHLFYLLYSLSYHSSYFFFLSGYSRCFSFMRKARTALFPCPDA